MQGTPVLTILSRASCPMRDGIAMRCGGSMVRHERASSLSAPIFRDDLFL